MADRAGTQRATNVLAPGSRIAGRRIVTLLGVAFVVAAAAALLTSPAFFIRRVRVEGLVGLTPEESAKTQACVAVPPQTNLFRAPTKQLIVALKRLPWVANVETIRHLPGTLGVRVIPRVPVAVLTPQTGQWELDAGGAVIRAARAGIGLPEIADSKCAAIAPGRLVRRAEVVEAVSALLPEGRMKAIPVSKIEVDQNEELCLNMQDKVSIRLGRIEDLPAKLALVRRIYEDPGIGAKVKSIDLRCPDAPACVPRAAAEELPQDTHSRSLRHSRRKSSRVPSRLSAD